MIDGDDRSTADRPTADRSTADRSTADPLPAPGERPSGAARRKRKRERDRAAAARQSQAGARGAGRGGGRSGGGGQAAGEGAGPRAERSARPSDPRQVAVDALVRIEEGGAYANLVLGPLLDRSGLAPRDRHLVTELVYGTTRMRRACDWLVDRFVKGSKPLDPPTRAALRLGAYQVAFLAQPPHAAVATAVGAAPRRSRGLVNAVLRKVADDHAAHGLRLPDPATALSYPDWIVERLTADLGEDVALAALEAMSAPRAPDVRNDGYTQDRASQWVAALVEAQPGERILDLCAAPGGKATALAASGAEVVAADRLPARVGLVAANAARTGTADHVHPVVADGTAPPLRSRSFDRVLVDAPCSGLGVLHRRPDARWRITADAVERLAALQVELVLAAADLVRPGGLLVVSVCTLTAAETTGVHDAVVARRPDLEALPPPGDPWVPAGSGALLLPQAAGTDGMALHRYRVP